MNTPDKTQNGFPQAPLRPPNMVMRLDRMGSFFPSRLSFMRTTIRRLAAEKAIVTRPVWEMDDQGYGRAVYSVSLNGNIYSLVAFSTKLAPENRTDRVIAQAWDTTYALFDGTPTTADLDRLEANAPKQEAGRFQDSELVLSRANKSVRLFEHVADSLSRGIQPDEKMIASIGYLMRTTAVYGNGKFGIADRGKIAKRREARGPFQLELLSVWLTRGFTIDLVEHVARCRAPETFVPLSRRFKRHLGIGNSTGLGMAPYLVSHPTLINNWILARETGIARVRGVEYLSRDQITEVQALVRRARANLDAWNVADKRQMDRVLLLRREWDEIIALLDQDWLSKAYPWQRLTSFCEARSLECQELAVALMLEPHGDIVNGLEDCMSTRTEARIDPAMRIFELRDLIDDRFSWTQEFDFDTPKDTHQFWYVSEEKLEPRLGVRYSEPGQELESPLDIARQVKLARADLEQHQDITSVAEFLMHHPEHRYVVRRIQTAARYPYSEIHDNLIGENCLPIDMLRSKLAFFGASKFDPKSDRWTRINMYQGAPLFDEVSNPDADDWWMPVMEDAT